MAGLAFRGGGDYGTRTGVPIAFLLCAWAANDSPRHMGLASPADVPGGCGGGLFAIARRAATLSFEEPDGLAFSCRESAKATRSGVSLPVPVVLSLAGSGRVSEYGQAR